MSLPQLMKVGDVIAYIREKYGMEITRMTVYNWMKAGRHGEVLDFFATKAGPSSPFKTVKVTTPEKVDAFLRCSGIIG